MKITRSYEVWTGGDMVEDFISNRDYAIELARKEVERELKEYPGETPDVVVDEIVHYTLTTTEEVDELEDAL